MAKKKAISNEVREQVEEIVEHFNTEELNSPTSTYFMIHEQNKLKASSQSLLKTLFALATKREKPVDYVFYSTRYRGKFLYLDRHTPLGEGPICRLTYTGDMENWDFAIYKYSSEKYAPDEWFFPGDHCVNGTVEGAMRAGMEAYPA